MPDTSDTSNTNATRVWHDWDTSDTSATRVPHEWKILVLIATRLKTCFYTVILLYDKWMTTRGGTISFEELPFGNALFPCQNAFKKCTTKTRLFNDKSYIEKLYTRL